MDFRGRRKILNPWRPAVFVVGVLAISMTLLFLGGYQKKNKEEIAKSRVVMRIKRPEHTALMETSASDKTKTRGGVQKTAEGKGKTNIQEKAGYYIVKKGDSLFKIAGLKDVYGDSTKWPSLFRMNRDLFNGMEITEDFPQRMLPNGLVLRYVTAPEAAEKLSRLGPQVWVANVLSSQKSKGIVELAIALMRKGRHVYMDRANVNGKEWMRLRVGFFKDRRKADFAAKEIKSILDLKDIWVTKIEKEELEEFGGY
jgi:hypothetical protein